MTEFKQIIGRGTRINEDFGKHYFTIMDFRNVTALFADKDFDGDPVRVKQVYENDDISETDREVDNLPVTDELTGEEIDFPDPETSASSILREDPVPYRGARKVTVNGVEVAIIKERVQYMDDDGKIITKSVTFSPSRAKAVVNAIIKEQKAGWRTVQSAVDSDDFDADASDVVLQHIVLGDLVFG
jgi:type I restriction enzyme R subunit